MFHAERYPLRPITKIWHWSAPCFFLAVAWPGYGHAGTQTICPIAAKNYRVTVGNNFYPMTGTQLIAGTVPAGAEFTITFTDIAGCIKVSGTTGVEPKVMLAQLA